MIDEIVKRRNKSAECRDDTKACVCYLYVQSKITVRSEYFRYFRKLLADVTE